MQKDLLHAGYLAIALVFFRQRHKLMTAPVAGAHSSRSGIAVANARSGGNDSNASGRSKMDLFLWLPTFNYFVIACTLLYQVGHTSLPRWVSTVTKLG